ncbi:hypothetical protein EV182_003775 [Spiromyces aspiralis]|uniref:Uncharacterized protein n=1 Tax=Spiromyces aspiralis TaxID=68401 RepID=A0ACC1HIR4_9FUNG|nr:hypothetical protein EV182_003775 [Spiromyces aspiralis]
MLDKEEARRRRQERILKRGSDRLSRIKSSLHESLQEPIADNAVAALQDDKAPQMCPPRNAGSETPPLSSLSSEPGSGTESETSKVMSSTHDRLSTAAMAQSLSTQSPGTLSPPRPSTPTPRRRVGNLARKIRSSGNGIVNSQSVDMDNIDRLLAQQFFESSSLDGDDKTSALAAGPQGTAGYRSVTATSQIKGSQQPKTSARSAGSNAEDKLSPRTKALLESLDKEGVPSGQHDTGLSSLFTPMPPDGAPVKSSLI